MGHQSDIDSFSIITGDDAALATQACALISHTLKTVIEMRGTASLMVSGGSSPKPLFAALAKEGLAWEAVTVSLVDERWVEPVSYTHLTLPTKA